MLPVLLYTVLVYGVVDPILPLHCTLDTQADTTRIFHFGILEQF